MFQRVIGLSIALLLVCTQAYTQELFPYTEPASNMPTNAIGIRVGNEGTFKSPSSNRSNVELMLGLNRNLMVHGQVYYSNAHHGYGFDGFNTYAKYRFYTTDALKQHFRMAAFGKLSYSKLPVQIDDVNLEGDNSAWQAGIIATQLVQKLAISATFSYVDAFEKKGAVKDPSSQVHYSLSSGYLLLPFVYKNYNQPNFNLYVEMLGRTNLHSGKSYVDIAPAVQFILNSKTRIDLGYSWQLAGNMPDRYASGKYLARVEFNLFNAL